MRQATILLVCVLLLPAALATGIQGVPSAESRNIVITQGLQAEFPLTVHGAMNIDASVSAAPAIKDYVTLLDSAPGSGPRTVRLKFDFPRSLEDIPPGVYRVSFNAHEVPEGGSMVSTAVNVGFSITLRKYADEPLLEISGVEIPSAAQGTNANFTVNVISRTTQAIPQADAQVFVLDNQGEVIGKGEGKLRGLESGAAGKIRGTLPTNELPGGIYNTRTVVTYGQKSVESQNTLLRIGILSIDLMDGHTNSFIFNQTNKFKFRLQSNWNKPLTNVLSTVSLLGQEKRSAPEDISAFGQSNEMELYFDRTQDQPGPINGTLVVTYQEKSLDPTRQDQLESHRFEIPIFLDIILPQQPAEVKQPFELKPMHFLIAAIIILVLLNAVVLYVLFRKKDKEGTDTREP